MTEQRLVTVMIRSFDADLAHRVRVAYTNRKETSAQWYARAAIKQLKMEEGIRGLAVGNVRKTT